MRNRMQLLVVGTGDVAGRALPSLAAQFDVLALARTPRRAAELAALPLHPMPEIRVADLDDAQSLDAALEITDLVLHCAPPAAIPASASLDERTRTLLAALDRASVKARGIVPRRFVYVSTSGVYGNCAGALVDEDRPVSATTGRAHRRVDAEQQLAAWCTARRVDLVILRVPGIYAADRLPLERVKRGTPVLCREDDVYTNHIHADDLARICDRALNLEVPVGVYNTSDDSELLMGDWMDLVADHFSLPRPPRISRSEAAGRIDPGMLSFMSESRRLVNRRLKQQMGYELLYPTVRHGLAAVPRVAGNA